MERRTRQTKGRLPCFIHNCPARFKSNQGHSQHMNAVHTSINCSQLVASRPHHSNPPSPVHGGPSERDESPMDWDEEPVEPEPAPQTVPQAKKHLHPHLTGMPCDANGVYLVPGTQPSSQPIPNNLFEPFDNEVQFRLADFLFCKVEMSQGNIDELLELWALSQKDHDTFGPFADHDELYDQIDAIKLGDAPWKCIISEVPSDLPRDAPSWQRVEYQIWYRDPDTVISNMLANTDFANEFDVAPYVHINAEGKRHWCDFMSGNYAWRHSTQIHAENPNTKGAMYVGIIVGADKTTVSVATGHVEYHPLYISIGNIHNSVRRAHRNGVIPIGFLAIPKSERKYDNDPAFRLFKKKLYHQSIVAIFQSIKPAMTTPVVRRCPDGHYRRVIYDFAAFIADYPEQVYLSGIVGGWCCKCTAWSGNLDGEAAGRRTRELTETLLEEYAGQDILWFNFGIDEGVLPFTHFFPRADIHEMLTPDLLHQIIKGTFKDHLVDWVGEYLVLTEGEKRANEILDDIDRRIAAAPAFPGLRRFPHGRRFKQWTGDDSKALMKVYLPAIADYLPEPIMLCLSSFLDFCYLVRQSDIDESTLADIERAVEHFHHYRDVFIQSGVRDDFSLPRQHAMVHYHQNIIDFGAPNGVCSSITESRHITAMLLTNQRLDKLYAQRAFLADKGLVAPNHPPPPDPFDLEKEDEGPIDERVSAEVTLARTRERRYPRSLSLLADHIHQPQLPALLRRFLYDQLRQEDEPSADEVDIDDCPEISSKIYVYHSAIASFYAPSDISGIRGMRRERIRSTPSWYGHPRRDCAFVMEDESTAGFRGMSIVRVQMFLSFEHRGTVYPCALVHWFKKTSRSPDRKTGMWVVQPERRYTRPVLSVVHLDTLLRGAHLMPVFGPDPVPLKFHYASSLDCFKAFYVNKYADHHANEIVF
ncbi:hypothetical protein ARMSODRAFT_990497 [Armillaria solidipes]|uniref:C2H2-type domain-containing protein n=1 Tax=Armillaria solidipes TaxID=1076256 RepID=A0A2H3B557_9AGAR|nr:hypothetical protein ARMSODRAFT_990497 [Armillaria solidipes]